MKVWLPYLEHCFTPWGVKNLDCGYFALQFMLIITQIIRSCAITNYITSSILFLLFLHSFSSHSSNDEGTEHQKALLTCSFTDKITFRLVIYECITFETVSTETETIIRVELSEETTCYSELLNSFYS